MSKKYIINYESGATGSGWSKKVDTIKEVTYIIEELKDNYSAHITVFDNSIQDFIFWKNCLTYKFDID